MNIQVLGWYDHKNIGDEAYKIAFPALFPGHNISFVESLSGPEPDVVMLGGGDIVYPSFTRYIRQIANARKILASVTLTDGSDFEALGLFERRFVRDYRSSLLASQHGFPCTYLPDFTFVLPPDRKKGKELLRQFFASEGHELKKKVVVVVISNYLAYSQLNFLARDFMTFLKLSQDIAQVADGTDASFVFLPFSVKPPHDDCITNLWVSGRCKYYQKNFAIKQELNVNDTLNIIAAGDVVVSSRLHSTIFATLAGVPFIDLTHHTKNLGFIETVEKTSWSIPFWEFSIRDFKDRLNGFLQASIPDASLVKFTNHSKGLLRDAIIL